MLVIWAGIGRVELASAGASGECWRLFSSFFLLGSSVTGNAIGNLGKSSGNWLGIGLLAIWLMVGFFWLKNRK